MGQADDSYDVFFSYNRRDQTAVETVAQAARQHGLKVFLDCWSLVPGLPWRQHLEQIIASCGAVAVFVGPYGLGQNQQQEKNLALSRQERQRGFPVIPVLLPGADPTLDFLFQNTWVDLRLRLDDPLSLKILQAAVRGEAPGPELKELVLATVATVCPYRGLRPFREEDAPFFFGRGICINELTEAVCCHSLVALVGASGCGKSSVARAGLLPRVRRSLGGQGWEVVTLLPNRFPLDNLAAALYPLLEPEGTVVDRFEEVNKLARSIRDGEARLRQVVTEALAKKPDTDRLLLLVDQWEELYTLTREQQQKDRFLEEILDATENSPLTVVLTLRGDFYGQVLSCRPLADRLKNAEVKLGPMTREELALAIVEPARKVHLFFEPGLVERLLDDAGLEPGNLPLLEFALTHLWEQRRGAQLVHQVYGEMGRVQGAVAQKAEEIYHKLPSVEQQAAEQVFLSLVQAGENTGDTRRRATMVELGEANRELVKKLADARLVVTSWEDSSDQEMVEVAHEALIYHWQRYQDWLNADREFLLWRQRLRHDLENWQRTREDEGALLRGTRLLEAERWLTDRAESLSPGEIQFIQASLKLRERERLTHQRQQRNKILALTGGLMVALLLLAVAGWQWRQAVRQRQIAVTQGQIALSRQLAAQTQKLLDLQQLDLALLLSVEANRVFFTEEAQQALLSSLQSEPRIKTMFHLAGVNVRGMAFGFDGKTLISASYYDLLSFWDPNIPLSMGHRLKGEAREILCVAFNPYGTRLASSNGGIIWLWDLENRKVLTQIEAIKNWDGTSTFWMQGYKPFVTGPDAIMSLAISADGRILASGSRDGVIYLWDLENHQALGQPLTGHKDYVISLAFSPDGNTLASGSRDDTVILWDPKTHQPLGAPLTAHASAVNSLVFSPDGTTLVSGSTDKTIIFWDPKSGSPSGPPFTGHQAGVTSLAFSPNGQTLASGSTDGAIILWDLLTRQPLDSPLKLHKEDITSLVFSPDGETLASGSFAGHVILWDTRIRKGSGAMHRGHQEDINQVAFSPDGRVLASASDDRTVILWDARTRKPLGPPLEGHRDTVASLAFSPDGTILATGGGITVPHIILWNVRSGKPLAPPLQGHKNYIHSLAFSPDGRILASGSRDETIILWDVETGKPLGPPLQGHEGNVFSVAFSPDGRTLASGGYDRVIILWDLQTRQQAGEPLEGHEDKVNTVAFSPDGQILASGSHDTVILWDVKTRQPLGPLAKDKGGVESLAFSPDGAILAVGGAIGTGRPDGGTVFLYDPRTRQPLSAPLEAPVYRVQSIAFSPDGRTLAVGAMTAGAEANDSILFWDVATRQPMEPALVSQQKETPTSIERSNLADYFERACRIANRNLTPEEWRKYMGAEQPYHKTCLELPAPGE